LIQESNKPQGFFKYDFVDRELVNYMKDLLMILTTEDAELNIMNKNFLVDRIQGKLRDHGVNIEDKDFIGLVLEMIRIVHEIVQEEHHEMDSTTGDERDADLFLYIIGSTFYKVGIEAYTMEENSIIGIASSGFKLDEENRSVSIHK